MVTVVCELLREVMCIILTVMKSIDDEEKLLANERN